MEAVKQAEQAYAATQQKIKDTRQKNKAALEYRASIEKKFKELEEKIKSVTAKDAAAPEEEPAVEEPKKEAANSTPFEGKSEAVYILFVISYMLIRLSNQKELTESTAIKLRNYFKYFVKLIEIYEYQLIIGHAMNYPGSETKEDEQKGGADPTEQPKDQEPKEQESKDQEPKEQDPKTQELKEDPTFLRELRAFHAYLFMSVSSNNSVKQMLTNPTSDTFKTDQKWLSNLTSKEDTILTSKEFLNIQDKLFENLVSSFMILFAKFEVVANLRADVLEGKKSDLTTLNEHVAKFNSLESESGETEANAQVEILEKIMKEGPVPIKDPMILADKAAELAEDAEKIQSDIASQANSDKSILNKVYNAVAALFKQKLSTPKPAEPKPSTQKSAKSTPSAPPYPAQPQYPPVYPAQPQYPPVYPAQSQYPPVYPAQSQYPPVYPAQPQYPPVYPAQSQTPDNIISAPPTDTVKPFNAPYPSTDTVKPFNAPFPSTNTVKPFNAPYSITVGGRLRKSRRINKSKSQKKTLRRSKH